MGQSVSELLIGWASQAQSYRIACSLFVSTSIFLFQDKRDRDVEVRVVGWRERANECVRSHFLGEIPSASLMLVQELRNFFEYAPQPTQH